MLFSKSIVLLFTLPTLFTEPRVDKASAKRREEDLRSHRNWKHVYSFLADTAAITVQFRSDGQSCLTFETPWTAAHQASLSITNSKSLIKFMSIESVMPSPSHPLPSPSPPAFNLSQHQGLFQWVSSSHQVAKGLELQLQHQSFQWTARTDFL